MNGLMNDWELERWARIYRGNRIDLRMPGLTFGQFLQRPNEYLIMVIYREPQAIAEAAPEFLPLLPEQEVASLAQVWREGLEEACRPAPARAERSFAEQTEEKLTADAVHRGDRYVTPLRHHTYALSKERGVTR